MTAKHILEYTEIFLPSGFFSTSSLLCELGHFFGRKSPYLSVAPVRAFASVCILVVCFFIHPSLLIQHTLPTFSYRPPGRRCFRSQISLSRLNLRARVSICNRVHFPISVWLVDNIRSLYLSTSRYYHHHLLLPYSAVMYLNHHVPKHQSFPVSFSSPTSFFPSPSSPIPTRFHSTFFKSR